MADVENIVANIVEPIVVDITGSVNLLNFTQSRTDFIILSNNGFNAEFNDPFNAANFLASRDSSSLLYERWTYLDYMYIGVDTPNGYVLCGEFWPHDAGTQPASATFALSGTDAAKFSINSDSGAITLTDAASVTTAGDLSVTVVISGTGTAVDGNYAITIPVVDDSSNVKFVSENGDDSNDGLQPHKPKLSPQNTFAEQGSATGLYTVLYKRGGTFNDAYITTRNNRIIGGYGDISKVPAKIVSAAQASLPGGTGNPHLVENVRSGGSIVQNENITLRDLWLDGNDEAIRLIFLNNYQGSDTCHIHRIIADNNLNNANSSGIHIETLNGAPVRSRWCQVLSETKGDGYFVRDSDDIAVYCADIAPPGAGAADNVQVAYDGTSGQESNNVLFSHCIFRGEKGLSSTKGAVAIAGANQWLFDRCYMYGAPYFATSAGGTKGTIRACYSPESEFSNNNRWAFGVGNEWPDAHDIDIADCYMGETRTGHLVSGYDAGYSSSLNRQLYDIRWRASTMYKNYRLGKATEAWSGIWDDWVGIQIEQGTTFNITGNGANTATGGDYTTKTITNISAQDKLVRLPSTKPAMTGSFKDGTVVKVVLPSHGGHTANVSFCINHNLAGEIVGRTVAEQKQTGVAAGSTVYFVIPNDVNSITNDNMPNIDNLRTSCVSCEVRWQDSAGNLSDVQMALDSTGDAFPLVTSGVFSDATFYVHGAAQASGAVSAWGDITSNEYDATQGTSDFQPNRTGAIDGIPAVDFDGTNDRLGIDSNLYSVPSGNNTVLMVFQSDSDSTDQRLFLGTVGSGSRWGMLLRNDTNSFQGISNTSFTTASISITPDTDPHFGGMRRNGATVTAYYDGSTATAAGANVTCDGGNIGNYAPSNSSHFDGKITAIAVWSRALSDAEVTEARTEFQFGAGAP